MQARESARGLSPRWPGSRAKGSYKVRTEMRAREDSTPASGGCVIFQTSFLPKTRTGLGLG